MAERAAVATANGPSRIRIHRRREIIERELRCLARQQQRDVHVEQRTAPEDVIPIVESIEVRSKNPGQHSPEEVVGARRFDRDVEERLIDGAGVMLTRGSNPASHEMQIVLRTDCEGKRRHDQDDRELGHGCSPTGPPFHGVGMSAVRTQRHL